MSSGRIDNFVDLDKILARGGAKIKDNPLDPTPKAVAATPTSRTSRHDYKADLVQQLALVKIAIEPEFKFCPTRKWSADWRVSGTSILIEFEGGLFDKGKGGHSSIAGILRDISKYNEAAILGYIVIRVAPNHVSNGEALQWIERALKITLET